MQVYDVAALSEALEYPCAALWIQACARWARLRECGESASAFERGKVFRLWTWREGTHAQVIRAIARSALVEPSAAALDEAGVELTDAQYMQIFGYEMQGGERAAPISWRKTRWN